MFAITKGEALQELEIEHETEMYIYMFVLDSKRKRKFYGRVRHTLWDSCGLSTSEREIVRIPRKLYLTWRDENIVEKV